jgi:hypothetical protein
MRHYSISPDRFHDYSGRCQHQDGREQDRDFLQELSSTFPSRLWRLVAFTLFGAYGAVRKRNSRQQKSNTGT